MDPSTKVEALPTPEALIPEARYRQRRRYRRSAVLVSVVAVLVGALVALVIMVTSNGSVASRSASKPSVVATSHAIVLIRPVLCFASPSVARQKKSGPLPGCAAPYALTAATLNVTPNSAQAGYSSDNVGPDPKFARYPSSTGDSPSHAVLLGALGRGTSGGLRYVLGPSELRLSTADVESASAHKSHAGQWIVSMHLSSDGAAAFDRVAHQNFHQLLAIDMGGKVVSAPLIQPTQASFSSFDGVIQVSDPLTASNARALAAAVRG